MKVRKEFIMGVIACFTLIAFYWGFSFLKGSDIFKKEREFVLLYTKVSGLTSSNPVLINGLKVGKVSYVGFMENDPQGRILVKINVYNDIKIPSNSVAVIKSDLLGVNTIEIMLKPSDKYVQSGDTLQTAIAITLQEQVTMQIQPLKNKVEDMISSMDTILAALSDVFMANNKEGFLETFTHLKNIMYNLDHSTNGLNMLINKESSNLNKIFANVEGITATLDSNKTQISTIINNFSDISDTLAKANIAQIFANMDKATSDFQQITNKINTGKGTVGQLINNDSLYNELERSSTQLKELITDFKLNPSRYVKVSVFGGKNKDPYKKAQ